MAFLTIFTAPKPFTDPFIATLQRNAIESWTHLGPEVEVILIGDESGIAEAAQEFEVKHLPEVACNVSGTPLVSSIFDLARQNSDSPVLVYVNADILFLPDVITAARQVHEQAGKYLIVGQRWDLEVTERLDYSQGWAERLQLRVADEGKLHPRGGSDYFIFPRTCFETIPDFAIGRAGWDNWMFYEARQRGWALVDATPAIQIVHQNHDYRHLPKGQPHYRLPETQENIRLAGGKRAIFNLLDADRTLVDGKIERIHPDAEKFWREVEIFPLVKLHSRVLGQVFFAVFHPGKAFQEFKVWLVKTFKSSRENKE
jgi:hypothetical protein